MSDQNYRNHALPPELLQALEALGYERLTPIQAMSLPLLRAGRDIIGESQTGSGKTIAFALPLLEKIRTENRSLQGLILCPTRELCDQVAASLRGAGRFKRDLLVSVIVGGQPVYLQLRSLRHGVHVVIGTPGRVLDLVERGKLDLSEIHTVVLDEADRMLDMGFIDDIEKILQRTPKTRQTALFSATYPPTIEGLSRRYQNDPERVRAEVPDSEKPAIEQIAYRVDDSSRLPTLVRLLSGTAFESALVFCNLKVSVDELTEALRRAGLQADKIHGDLEQRDRDRVMARFRNGSTRILVATDVAARGLDVLGLDAVFNFELAKDPQTHVHRIGRTGRAGKPGLAITLWTEMEKYRLERIEAFMQAPLRRGDARAPKDSAPVKKLPDLETLEISGGRKDKLRPGDILGALTGKDCGLLGTAIGKIEIKDHVSYVAVERASAKKAMQSLRQGKIKGRRFLVNVHSER